MFKSAEYSQQEDGGTKSMKHYIVEALVAIIVIKIVFPGDKAPSKYLN